MREAYAEFFLVISWVGKKKWWKLWGNRNYWEKTISTLDGYQQRSATFIWAVKCFLWQAPDFYFDVNLSHFLSATCPHHLTTGPLCGPVCLLHTSKQRWPTNVFHAGHDHQMSWIKGKLTLFFDRKSTQLIRPQINVFFVYLKFRTLLHTFQECKLV